MSRNRTTKKKRMIRLLIVLVLFVLVMFIGSAVYILDYYRADAVAQNLILHPSERVMIEQGESEELIFRPTNQHDIKTGIIFYPGGKVEYTAYAPLMSKLAERGFLCVLIKAPCNFAILDTDAADRILEAYPDVEDWYVGGHSLGGASVSMCMEKHSESYRGLILLGAYSSVDLSDTNLSVLSIYGENDGVMNRDHYEKDRVNLPEDFTEYVIPGGCHAWFGDYGAQNGDGIPTITADEQQTITADKICEWIGIS